MDVRKGMFETGRSSAEHPNAVQSVAFKELVAVMVWLLVSASVQVNDEGNPILPLPPTPVVVIAVSPNVSVPADMVFPFGSTKFGKPEPVLTELLPFMSH